MLSLSVPRALGGRRGGYTKGEARGLPGAGVATQRGDQVGAAPPRGAGCSKGAVARGIHGGGSRVVARVVPE